MADSIEDAVKVVKSLMGRFDRVVGDISRVEFGEGTREKFHEILRRAALIRQREAISAIIALCETGHAAFAVCMIRPAYEEMLWLMYFEKYPDDAAAITHFMTIAGIGKALEVQTKYIGEDTMVQGGFPKRFLESFAAGYQDAVEQLRVIGARLGWRKASEQPTLAHIAQSVGRKAEYDFIYEGTSRFVHFSPHELTRRGWGTQREMFVSSNTFAPFWGRFALYWSIRIFSRTLATIAETLPEHQTNEPLNRDAITEFLEQIGPVPIITVNELEWFTPNDARGAMRSALASVIEAVTCGCSFVS